MLTAFARHLCSKAPMQSARLHTSVETAACRAAEQLARSSMHLRALDCTAASCLYRLRHNLAEAGLSFSRRHISSSIQASERGSVATDRSAAVSSEWDDVLDPASGKKPQKQGRPAGRESRGASRFSESSKQPAASSSGWGDDWDLSSDRSTRREGSPGVQGSWGADKRYGGRDSRRGGTEGRGRGTGSRGRGVGRGSDPSRSSWEGRGSQAPSSNRWDGGTAAPREVGRGSDPSRNSWEGRGSQASSSNRWDGGTAPSRDSWGTSSRGQASETRGSWRGGSARGGRGRNDREGQYGRSGNTWQPRDRVDDPAMPRAPQLADKLKGEALYGVNPVIGALQAMRRECHTLYIQEANDGQKKKEGIPQAIAAMKAAGGSIEYVTKHELNQVVDNRPHQGLVLDCSSLAWEPMDHLPSAQEAAAFSTRLPVWLALDEIEDPQNMGAAVRAAYFLGVSGILTCARNSAPLSPAVSKASAGALEFMSIHACNSMPRTLTQAAEQGWHVVGAGNDVDATSSRSFKTEAPTILVVGNEGRGLRSVVRRACKDVLRIDSVAATADQFSPVGVESLNVSVAAGILLHQLLHAQ